MDFGEQSYSMVLADDLDNNGRLDLLVATMNGNLYALETSALYHPMKAWTSVVGSMLTSFTLWLCWQLQELCLHGQKQSAGSVQRADSLSPEFPATSFLNDARRGFG